MCFVAKISSTTWIDRATEGSEASAKVENQEKELGRRLTCSVGGRAMRRSASIIVFVGAWKKARSCRTVSLSIDLNNEIGKTYLIEMGSSEISRLDFSGCVNFERIGFAFFVCKDIR